MESPSQAFERIRKGLRFCASLVGCNIFKEGFRINLITVLVSCSIISYFVCAVITVVNLYKENWKIILETFCMACSVFQGGIKLTSTLFEAKIIVEKEALVKEIYEKYEQQGPKYVEVLHRNCGQLRRLLKIIFVTYLLSGVGITVTPFIMLFATGRRYLIMQFHFPFLDVSTSTGYFMSLGLQSSFVFAATFGLFSGDLLAFILLTQSFLFVDIFKLKIESFNEMVSHPDQNCKENEVMDAIKDIIQWHQVFTKTCNDIFFYVVSVMVTTAGASIIFSIFIILTGDFPGAYPYLLISIYTLYVYCILGTKIDICNDEFCAEIYNISWYQLKAPQQRLIRLILMQSQRPEELYVAGIFPLSVATALQITKFIYSIFMMMGQFLLEETK